MSKERPILFNGAMVRAILAGQKTQTRRAVKVPVVGEFCGLKLHLGYPASKDAVWAGFGNPEDPHYVRCPFGQPGDRLWVREAHAIFPTHGQHRADGERWGPWGGLPTTVSDDGTQIAYYREGFERCDPGRWCPSIHMPRWACRLVLEITAVRVERLQALQEADWEAEGISFCIEDPDTTAGRAFSEAEHYWIAGVSMRGTPEDHGMRAQFAEQGLDWDSNPWVWVIEFKAVTP